MTNRTCDFFIRGFQQFARTVVASFSKAFDTPEQSYLTTISHSPKVGVLHIIISIYANEHQKHTNQGNEHACCAPPRFQHVHDPYVRLCVPLVVHHRCLQLNLIGSRM